MIHAVDISLCFCTIVIRGIRGVQRFSRFLAVLVRCSHCLWNMPMMGEERFKRSRAPEVAKRVFEGVADVDGRGEDDEKQTKAA